MTLDFETRRAQSISIGNTNTSTGTTAPPQECVLSPPPFCLTTVLKIIEFADDVTVAGLISSNDESAYKKNATDDC